MFAQLSVKDIAALQRFDNMLSVLGSHKTKLVEVRALKHTGNKARTALVGALSDEIGLSTRIVSRLLGRPVLPNFGDLRYRIVLRGEDIPLRLFKARETRKGVTAEIGGRRELFEGSFIKGGSFPKRVGIGMGGNVFEREGTSRLGIVKVKSGVVLPIEAMKGAPRAAFDGVVKKELPKRVAHEINRISGGMFS